MTEAAPRSGSVGMVLLVALLLVAAAAGLIYIGRDYAETYIKAMLAGDRPKATTGQTEQTRSAKEQIRAVS